MATAREAMSFSGTARSTYSSVTLTARPNIGSANIAV
jgi:hypothetical protein